MKRPAKRKRPPTANDSDSEIAHKRQATEETGTIVEGDEDDLEYILAQIRQQEESEALARKLQHEWNSGSESKTGESSLSAIKDGDGQILDDDEAFARLLAAEWAEEDDAPTESTLPGPSATRRGERHHAAHERNGKAAMTNGTPDSQLESYRELFVGSRSCTECGHEIISPRGYVCAPMPLTTSTLSVPLGHLF
jgi:hypothetical protein